MGIGNGARVLACRHQACDMGHIHHQVRAHLIGNLPEALKINRTGISAGSRDDQLRLGFFCNPLQFIIINEALIIDPIGHNIVIHAGEIYRAAVGQVSAMV